eukprot:3941251-Rhodomonas_salina.1
MAYAYMSGLRSKVQLPLTCMLFRLYVWLSLMRVHGLRLAHSRASPKGLGRLLLMALMLLHLSACLWSGYALARSR